MNYNFTDRTRKVLALAREEALSLNHDYVGTEHILLGLVAEGEGVAVAVLLGLNVDMEQLRALTHASVRKGKDSGLLQLASNELPYTSRAKRVLEYAMHEARKLNHSYVGTEHLLMGLLGDPQTIAAQVLSGQGVTADKARNVMIPLIGADRPAQAASVIPNRPAPGTERLLRQLKATYHGPSWHGPTLRELLADVKPEQAAQHGIASAHSIWEIVLHSAAWKRVVAERLDGHKASLQGEADWPKVSDTSAEAWQASLAELDAAHDAVIQRVAELVDPDLDRQVPGQKASVYATVHGVMQHDIYHAGQIALLKKTVGR